RAGPMLMGALGPQAPQAEFLIVEGCDVGGEQGGTAGAQGVDELEVGDVVRLKDGVERTVELLELRVEPVEPCLRTIESAGAGVRQERTQDGNADGCAGGNYSFGHAAPLPEAGGGTILCTAATT